MIRQIAATTSRILAALALLVLAAACTSSGRDGLPWPTEEWRTSRPEEQHMDPALLQQMMDLVDEFGQG